MSRLTLIICTYCRPQPVKDLLASVQQQTRLPDETLIIDASPDDFTEQVVAEFQRANTIQALSYYQAPPEHRGLTRQRNYGIARVTGAIIAFLDDDTILEVDYFEQLLACFERHPEAAGVGGYITNGTAWKSVGSGAGRRLSVYRWEEWEKPDDFRNRLRRVLGLDSPLPPGWMPPFGHGRSVNYPPNGKEYAVEFIMGGASAWRSEIFARHHFSTFFEGYGLYEDLDFCVRVAREAPLFLCTRARLAHYHAAPGRPNRFHYGQMVVQNGWFVWRRRWPAPGWPNRFRWWAITILLTLCRIADSLRLRDSWQAITEASGRIYGMARVLINPPNPNKFL
jgi:GT2 family glycosyltransferase